MQDKTIVNIGKLQLKKSHFIQPHQQYIQNMFPGKEYNILIIVFKVEKDNENYNCTFEKLDMEKVSDSSYQKYAYRKGSSRGGDITFTTKYGDKKLKAISTQQFDKFLSVLKDSTYEDEIVIFSSVKKCLNDSFEQIEEKILEVTNNLEKDIKINLGLSLRIDINGEHKYLNDFQIVKDIILESGTEDKSKKHGVISEGHNRICSICYEKKETLYGFASPFKYYTTDKEGFISNFFDQKSSWRNYPICSDCAPAFEEGKNFITSEMRRYFYGKEYYIIPSIFIGDNLELLEKAVKIITSYKYKPADKKQKAIEDYFFRTIAEEKNYFNIDLLFVEENKTNKSIKIKLYLEEIFPSRFRTLFIDVPEKINKFSIYKNAIRVKKEPTDLKFDFGILITFFNDDFHELINKVFTGKSFNRQSLYDYFMNVIHSNYNKMQTDDRYVEPLYWTILKAHMTIAYLQELKCLPINKYEFLFGVKMNNNETKRTSKFDIELFNNFIKENSGFLDADYKVGIFAVGILTKLFMNIQMSNLGGSAPFEKKLKGLNISADSLRNIYVETIQKLNEYDRASAYKELRDIINDYFTLKSHLIKKLSNNEISFYFVAGLEMAHKFKAE